jgi:hypothetical protein
LGLVGLEFIKYIYLLCGKIVITEGRKYVGKSEPKSEHVVEKGAGLKMQIGVILD